MIVTEKTSWLRMIFAYRGTTIDKIWPRVTFVTLFATLITYLAVVLDVYQYSLTTAPLTVVGLALAIFLGFQNGAAYDRYWEGRKLWGTMVNVSRAFTVQTISMIGQTQDHPDAVKLRNEICGLLLAYVNSLRHRLRSTEPWTDIEKYLPSKSTIEELRGHDNVPVAISNQIANKLNAAYCNGHLDKFHLPMLMANVNEMLNVQGGCERILTTPIPYTYSVLTHRTVTLYCLALPCGLFDTVGLLTPVVVGLVAYAFLGLDAVGNEIEQPFGTDENDLPLHSITRTIEINVLQLMNTPPEQIPAKLQPQEHVLH